MKGNGFIKVKKLAQNPTWILRKINACLKKDRELERFFSFDCSSFFRGNLTAQRNSDIYCLEKEKNDRHYNILTNMETRLKKSI